MKHGFTLFSLAALMFAGSVSFANDVITVVDENQSPVANATVLFGYDSNNPFPGNTLTTDANGLASAPGAWKAALPVTVQAPGFVSATIPVAVPGSMTIQLAHQESATPIQVGGQTTGFGTLTDNGKVQFGMVIPAFNRSEMTTFDISTIISPQTDTISVLSQNVNLPSNVTLPTQTVTYVFPVKLDKPNYRSYVRYNGSTLMTAMHGNFQLSKVVSEIRSGESIFDMLNDFTFVEGGSATVNVNGNVTQDLPVNQVQFTGTSNIQAPQMASNQLMVSMALNQANGLMLPTDLKRFTSGQANVMHTAGSSPNVISLLMVNANASLAAIEKAFETLNPVNFAEIPAMAPRATNPQGFTQLSYNLMPAPAGGAAPQFIPLMAPPALDTTNNVLKMTPPTLPAGLQAVATYAVMTEVLSLPSGTVQAEQRTRLWEVWSPAWLNQIDLPKITFTRNPGRTYRWEVMYLAQPTGVTGGTTTVNGVDLNSVTHVTRNALSI